MDDDEGISDLSNFSFVDLEQDLGADGAAVLRSLFTTSGGCWDVAAGIASCPFITHRCGCGYRVTPSTLESSLGQQIAIGFTPTSFNANRCRLTSSRFGTHRGRNCQLGDCSSSSRGGSGKKANNVDAKRCTGRGVPEGNSLSFCGKTTEKSRCS